VKPPLSQVGNSVFANLRGTWTDAHRKSNMEWRLGSSKRLWGQEVRYHKGWGKTAEDAYSAIRTAVTDSFGIRDGNCNLYLSGHSRGAGAALLVAAFADGRDDAVKAPCRTAGVWTFGSVKPYNGALNKVYNSKLGSKTFNWWNQIDVVGAGGFSRG
jgi:hypothetical protein